MKYSLGIDTSNYKTSVALVDDKGKVLFNHQELLDVKLGERGLRQQEAFFQHIQRLPSVLSYVLNNEEYRNNIGAVSVSTRPRPVEGSYMPVFLAGSSFGKVIASSLNVPYYEFSHQEGHIEAIKYYTELKDKEPVICFHFSGGTTEAILVNKDYTLIGGTKDISFGQVLDRVGVSLGFHFPCGQDIDKLALSSKAQKSVLSPIKVKDARVNLSGIETQAQMFLEAHSADEIAYSVMLEISKAIEKMVRELSSEFNVNDFIFSGGVSSSLFVRKYISENLKDKHIIFGSPELSTDNAVGIALLGGLKIWL